MHQNFMERGREYLTYRSGLMLSQSVGAARGPNRPKALKKLVFSDYVPNIFFKWKFLHCCACGVRSGLQGNVPKFIYFFAEGPEMY